jgi:MYXO-CTERM domain-containing protein
MSLPTPTREMPSQTRALPKPTRAILAVATLVLLAATTPAAADTTAQNLDKYRALRQRLVSQFVSVGPAQGQSQPAPERMDNIGLMKWGDGTIALGFYLGVLATEHYMISHPERFAGAATDGTQLATTRGELYHALLALERLDRDADAAFPTPCTQTQSLNGFFLRDDVPADFYTRFSGITEIQSDFIDPTLTNKEESQDQVYHVQHGLALVIALVPDDVVVQGRPLRAWALEQAERIVRHFAKGDWIIRNPACGNRAVNRGENAIGFSYGEKLAATYLTAGAFTPTASGWWQNIWNTLKQPSNPAYDDEDNLHMALAIMAVSDGFGAETPDVVATLAAKQDWPLYPLLHRALHPQSVGFCTTATTVNPRARAMLDEVPLGADLACPGASGPAPHGFTTHNRFIRGKSQHYVGPQGCDGTRYHGLDYMLLHNLYAIATPGTWNGSPAADPCAPEVTPDGASVNGDDAGVGTDPDGTDPMAPGCGCRSASGTDGGLIVLLVLGMLAFGRRRATRVARVR